jgi:hypothetical protein
MLSGISRHSGEVVLLAVLFGFVGTLWASASPRYSIVVTVGGGLSRRERVP